MKRIINLIIALFALPTLMLGQGSFSNGIGIDGITSPRQGFNYDTNAVVDIKVFVINNGPNAIVNDDTLLFKVNIANSDTTESYNVDIRTNAYLDVGDKKEYTIISGYLFDQEQTYSVLVSIDGTADYPTNLTKNASKSISFIVGLENQKDPLNIDAVSYQNGYLKFNTNTSERGEISIHDLSGKVIFNRNILLQSTNELNFKAPAKGFYFLRINSNNGARATSKFVVH